MTAKKLHARLIDAEDKHVTNVDVEDLERKPGQDYTPREVILRGKKFREPSADVLDIVKPDEWREVIA